MDRSVAPQSDKTAAPALGPGSVSACLVVRNEEAVIERCLSSLQGVADEIVLVHDGPCHDSTLEIAGRFGCRTFVRSLTGNPEYHTVFAYEQARGEWLLNVDADEFLSPELRDRLPELARQDTVDGFEFLWRMWDGSRYVTERGPYKAALFRRSATHMVGVLSGMESVDGEVQRLQLLLEHRPLYNNFAPSVVLSKWRRWCRIQARQYLSDYDEVPKFNQRNGSRWPLWRRIANWLSPLLIVPWAVATFCIAFAGKRSFLTLRENVRFSAYQGIYAGMVQAYVAKYRYFGLPEPETMPTSSP